MTDSPSDRPGSDQAPEPVEAAEQSEPTALSILTDFTPVPRRFNRGDVWTEEVQRTFIAVLADCGSVEAACRFVGRSPASAYRLRRHPLGAGFAAAWQAAVDFGMKLLEDFAMDRAINGVEVPVFLNGGEVVMRRHHNENLVMFMLRNRASDRYDRARSLNAIDARMLARLKQQWREEWEREAQEREDEEEQEVRDSIDRFLDRMSHNRRANMSPAQREREIAAQAQARADEAAGWSAGMPYGDYAEEAARLLPRMIAEVEAEWPPLPDWAWEEPEGEEADADEAPALPPPVEEAEAEPGACPEPSRGEPSRGEPSGPRVRSLKDEGW